jgi:2-keto-3-deoxy-galactonokinase
MTVCKYCDTDRPEAQFQKAGLLKKTGEPYKRLKCTVCKMADQRRRVAKHLNEVREYKALHGCATCGFQDVRALQLHHRVAEDKEDSVVQGVLLGWSLKKIEAELKKCVVLCANCHSILHWDERNRV